MKKDTVLDLLMHGMLSSAELGNPDDILQKSAVKVWGNDVELVDLTQSFSGEIESDFPLEVRSLRGERRSVSGVYGDGSAFIEATTFSGDVTVEKK